MASPTKGSFTVIITGEEKLIADLSKRSAPQSTWTLQRSVRKAATVLKPFIVSQAPVGPPRTIKGFQYMGGATKKSVSVRTMRKRPGEAAAVSVGPRVWYRHFPIGGTSRGVEPNPWVARGRSMGSSSSRGVLTGSILAEFKKP